MTSPDIDWTPDRLSQLRHPAPVRALLAAISGKNQGEAQDRFDLLFHAAFAERIFTIMRREGKETDGFDRMQQSFRDSVEKIRAIVQRAGQREFTQAALYTQLTPDAMSKLLDLVHDLALIKSWERRE